MIILYFSVFLNSASFRCVSFFIDVLFTFMTIYHKSLYSLNTCYHHFTVNCEAATLWIYPYSHPFMKKQLIGYFGESNLRFVDKTGIVLLNSLCDDIIKKVRAAKRSIDQEQEKLILWNRTLSSLRERRVRTQRPSADSSLV